MAWFSGKVSLGNFPDLAGAVNKLSESVKNIEKNFDSALGLEEKNDTTSSTSSQGLWPVMSFMGQQNDEGDAESNEKSASPRKVSKVEEKESDSAAESGKIKEENEAASGDKGHVEIAEGKIDVDPELSKAGSESEAQNRPSVSPEAGALLDIKALDLVENQQEKEIPVMEHSEISELVVSSGSSGRDKVEDSANLPDMCQDAADTHETADDTKMQAEEAAKASPPVQDEMSIEPSSQVLHEGQEEHLGGAHVELPSEAQADPLSNSQTAATINQKIPVPDGSEKTELSHESPLRAIHSTDGGYKVISESVSDKNDAIEKATVEERQVIDSHLEHKVSNPTSKLPDHENKESSPTSNLPDYENKESSPTSKLPNPEDGVLELEKVRTEMKIMEKALQGAARQAQSKADEIARLMNENEQLKSAIDDLKRKSNDAEVESLREEYHQRVATLERKVYALTKERDTLRREQSKKIDAAALLKEKDEIITQVMAEGEELSKKQAAQESTIRKLRAQIRELEEEKKGLVTKLQVEENKVDSLKKDKAATEKLLQETIEKHQSELAAQKEYYTTALAAAKEAEAMAEARANNEARSELESRFREAEERESMLVQALEELRQTLTRNEQQAIFREDMLRKDVEDLQKRYQASERRCEELIMQVPDSTRPLLRQIEAMQETAASRTEVWSAVERSLNSRLQEAEAKAAAAKERERSVNERLSQTLSRINVLEAQISCLRAEQTQLTKSLEKERQRAAENRQEYLAAKEEADTQEGRANQLEEEIKELRRRHKQELQDALMQRELLQEEVDRERAARSELERTSRIQSTVASEQVPLARTTSAMENGSLSRKLSNASSLSSMEESYFLQASLETSSDGLSERRNHGEFSPYYVKSMTPSAFEATLRQKEGELASYMSRLASMESIRDSLAEELVKMTAQCKKLRTESALLPGIRAELDALRRRHSAALELMGERDEELEELRADIVDLKEMYREQMNLLVNKIQIMSSSMGNA